MVLRLLIAGALVALNAALFMRAAQPEAHAPVAAANSQPQPALTPQTQRAPLHLIRVRVNNPADIQLLATQFDLTEARDGDAYIVQGGDDALTALRERGFAAEIQQTLPSQDASFERSQTYYGGYRTVAEHWAHLDDVAARYPQLTKLVDYGDSWRKINGVAGGHDLRAICITKLRDGDCAQSPETDKPRFLMIAAIHSRELSTGEVAWRWIDYLVDNYGVDADVTWMLDHQELWVVPLANPDGRSIVQLRDSEPYLHRKNANTVDGSCATSRASSQYGGSHPGVDLNRNGSWRWELRVTASDSRCDAVYRGPGPASEPENYFLEQLSRDLFRDQRAASLSSPAPITTSGGFLTLHSFANQVLMPWSFTGSNPPNNAGLRALGFRMAFYNRYQTGQSPEILYGTSGSTDDYTYGELGIPSYTFEVGPGSGACAGFIPPYWCQDRSDSYAGFWEINRQALLYMARSVRQPYATAHGPTATSVSVSTTLTSTGATASIRASFNDDALGSSGVGRPEAQTVIAAQAFVDTPPWLGGTAITMTLADGNADSLTEAFIASVPISANLTSKRLIYVRGIDANGDIGPVRAVWLQPFNGATGGPEVASITLSTGTITTATQLLLTADISHTTGLTVTAAELYIDALPWEGGAPITLTLSDGSADAAREQFSSTLNLSGTLPGLRTIYVRGFDANGKIGKLGITSFYVWDVEPTAKVFLPMAVR